MRRRAGWGLAAKGHKVHAKGRNFVLWSVGPSEVREVPGSLWMMHLQERRLEAGGAVRKPGSCPCAGGPGAQD